MSARHRSLLARIVVVAFASALTVALTGAPAQAANRVRLSASDQRLEVGQQVVLAAKVSPARRGRTVVFWARDGRRWENVATDRTNRNGAASARVRFTEAGAVTVRAVAERHRGKAERTDELRLTVAKGPTEVGAAFPAGPWTVGDQVAVPVTVAPAETGRRVWLERYAGGSWARIADPVATADGTAVARWTPTRVGTATYRVAVAASPTSKAGRSAETSREIRNRATGTLEIAAPDTVETNGIVDFSFEVSAGDEGLTDAALTVQVPDTGSHVTPPDELEVDPATSTAVLELGDLAEGSERTVPLRWQAPGTPVVLEVDARLVATDVDEQTSHAVEVVPEVGGGFVFDGGLESFTESRDAPTHTDQVYGSCFGGTPPSTAPVPPFADALAQAQAFIAVQMDGRPTDAWEALAAQEDADLLDEVAAIAFADQRYAGALAASLRAYELDPGDGVHLSNAAAAANLLDRPEWAIAFSEKAAEAGPGQSVGVRQEAARLVNLGHAWALKRNYAAAVAALREAVQIDPDSQAVRAELGAVLACQGNKAAALPQIRRSLRTDDTPDPMVDEHEDETLNRSRIDSSTLFDLSGGKDQELTLPPVPPTWGELLGRSNNYGNGYYQDEYWAAHERSMSLYEKRNDLEAQLRARQANQSPAQVRRTEDILNRIGTTGDRRIRDAWNDLIEDDAAVIHLNNCQGMFPDHVYCGVESMDTSCSLSSSLFNEWERRLETYIDSLAAFHDLAGKHYSGLQSLLSDPVAHELAGVRAELVFRPQIGSLLANLWITSREFGNYNEHYDGREEDDPPCTSLVVPGQDDPVSTERVAADFCAPDSAASKVNFNLDLEVVAIKANCEEWSVEAVREVGWLEAFGKYEAEYGNNGATLNIGVRIGAGGAAFESGLYLQQDANGKVVDFGWQVGPEFEPGGTLTISAYEDKVKISIMSVFTAP